ncbi:hypothetical protein FACS1894133_7390 [Clostridia bacterium]|nr:hypothetical protein FACS1894133_7390 [Clostridia bacterium]
MGMTDKQFASHCRRELKDFEEILAMVKKIQPDDSELVRKIEKLIELAKADIEV